MVELELVRIAVTEWEWISQWPNRKVEKLTNKGICNRHLDLAAFVIVFNSQVARLVDLRKAARTTNFS